MKTFVLKYALHNAFHKSATINNIHPISGVKFTMSTERGADGISDQIEGYSKISSDGTYIDCAILPLNGIAMDFSLNYVYDVQVFKAGTPGVTYDLVTTLLTGTISVTEQITGALEALLS
jgi:hypothetical protein